MAYETYTTEALVCGTYPEREHDLSLRLFTRDAGMIYARAGGARAVQSKLRYGLQNFSHVRVTLVKGRADWRVTGAVAIDNLYYQANARSARAALLSAMRSLRRLIQGAGGNPELFAVVLDGMQSLAQRPHASGEQLFLLRLLHHLGYVPPEEQYVALLHAESLEVACALCTDEGAHRSLIARTIENALTSSHL